jgi:hypothetical protein
MTLKLPDRFWEKVNKGGPLGFHWRTRAALGPCWIWTAGKSSGGYGKFKLGESCYAHALTFESVRGPVPAEHELDHLCRVRACCNPDHLEAVTHVENVRRGDWHLVSGAWQRARTHCPKGHLYEGDNLCVTKNKRRRCRTCNRDDMRNRRQRALGIAESSA